MQQNNGRTTWPLTLFFKANFKMVLKDRKHLCSLKSKINIPKKTEKYDLK